MPSILPLAKTTFVDGNGDPIAFGTVDFFIPATSTRKDTYQDSSGLVLNTNPVELDLDGRAIIFGTGQYRQVVKDSGGNTVWDQLTGEASSTSAATSSYWAGTATGSANALVLTIASGPAAYSNGMAVDFVAGFVNTGATTANVNGIGAVAVENNGVALVGGELQTGKTYRGIYTGAALQLSAISPDMSKRVDIASANVVDLTNVNADYIRFTGNTQINQITLRDSQWVDGVFEQALTVQNGASLILPGAANILTAAGDTFRIRGEAASVTRMVMYSRASTLATESYGTYAARGVVGQNNAVTPNTQFDWNADAVILKNSGNGVVVRPNPGIITNDINAASPNPNARDQAGGFVANTWIHFYWIWNGATLATLSSLTAPPTGPTLPAGYTHWAYAGAIRLNGSTQLTRTRVRGNKCYYEARIQAVTSGTIGETVESVATEVPPNALSYVTTSELNLGFGGPATVYLIFRLVTGVDFDRVLCSRDDSANIASKIIELPNVGQSFIYTITGSVGENAQIYITAYSIPNGSE